MGDGLLQRRQSLESPGRRAQCQVERADAANREPSSVTRKRPKAQAPPYSLLPGRVDHDPQPPGACSAHEFPSVPARPQSELYVSLHAAGATSNEPPSRTQGYGHPCRTVEGEADRNAAQRRLT
jgi:hypothetical protein